MLTVLQIEKCNTEQIHLSFENSIIGIYWVLKHQAIYHLVERKKT